MKAEAFLVLKSSCQKAIGRLRTFISLDDAANIVNILSMQNQKRLEYIPVKIQKRQPPRLPERYW